MRYGDRIRAGGDLATAHEEFVTWAAGYEVADFPGRSRTLHEEWILRHTGRVVRIDTDRPVAELVRELTQA